MFLKNKCPAAPPLLRLELPLAVFKKKMRWREGEAGTGHFDKNIRLEVNFFCRRGAAGACSSPRAGRVADGGPIRPTRKGRGRRQVSAGRFHKKSRKQHPETVLAACGIGFSVNLVYTGFLADQHHVGFGVDESKRVLRRIAPAVRRFVVGTGY